MFWPCETRISTCRSFATISSGLYRFLAIAVLLDVKDIPQVGPLQWGWIISERYNLVELNLALCHPENCAIEVDVLAPGELGVEAGADLEKACDAPPQHDQSLCRLRDAAQDLEKSALSGAIAANDPKNFTLPNLEA